MCNRTGFMSSSRNCSTFMYDGMSRKCRRLEFWARVSWAGGHLPEYFCSYVSTSLVATQFSPLPVEELSGRSDKYDHCLLLLSIGPRWLMPLMYCSHIGLLYKPWSLVVPICTVRCLHQRPQQWKEELLGREMADEFLPENARLPRNIQGSFTCRKYATWDKCLYFPSEGRRAEEFFRPEKSDGFGRVWTLELGYQRPARYLQTTEAAVSHLGWRHNKYFAKSDGFSVRKKGRYAFILVLEIAVFPHVTK